MLRTASGRNQLTADAREAADARAMSSPVVWGACLSVVYALVSVYGWHRTLIVDEIWYLLRAGLPFWEQFESLRADLTHPPLMYLIERVWMRAFGATDDAVKVLVLVINVSTITLFAVFAAHVLRGWRLASVLFCTAYLQIDGVPNLARGYSLGLLLTTTALLAWELWRCRGASRDLLLWAASMVLLAYTHYVGLLLLVPFVIVNWLYGRRPWLFLLAASVVAVCFIPWFAAVLPVYQSRGLDQNIGWVEKNPWLILAKMPFHFLTYLPAGANPFGQNDWPVNPSARTMLMASALAVHAALLLLARRRLADFRRPWSRAATGEPWVWSAALLAAFPIVALLAFSLAVHPALDARFLAFILPMYWMLVTWLAESGGVPGRVIAYSICVPWLLVSVTIPMLRNTGGSALHRSVDVVAQQIQPTDLILCERLAGPQVYWEWTRTFHRRERLVIESSRKSDLDDTTLPYTVLDAIPTTGVARVWVFATTFNPDGAAGIRRFLVGRGFAPSDSHPEERSPHFTLFARP